MARVHYIDYLTDQYGAPITGAVVTVGPRFFATPCSVYINSTGPTLLATPITTLAGKVEFWLDDTIAYNITYAGTGFQNFTTYFDAISAESYRAQQANVNTFNSQLVNFSLGRIAGQATSGPSILTFEQPGYLSTGTGIGRILFPLSVDILSVTTACYATPTGSSIIVDINKNGTTLFTTQGNRPTIAIGANASTPMIPAITRVGGGEYITCDIDQVGSTLPGSDLSVIVRYNEVASIPATALYARSANNTYFKLEPPNGGGPVVWQLATPWIP